MSTSEGPWDAQMMRPAAEKGQIRDRGHHLIVRCLTRYRVHAILHT